MKIPTLGKERCTELLKKVKKGVNNAVTKRLKKPDNKIVYGRGVRSK